MTDTKAIRAQMEALDGFTAGPWRFIPWHLMEGPPSVIAPAGWLISQTSSDIDARLIAAAPDMRATILALCDEVDGLRTIIDNLHHVEKKHRDTANDQFHRANRLRAENERLRHAFTWSLRHTSGKELRRMVGDLHDTSDLEEFIRAIERAQSK